MCYILVCFNLLVRWSTFLLHKKPKTTQFADRVKDRFGIDNSVWYCDIFRTSAGLMIPRDDTAHYIVLF